jgi:hypothetical protein
MMEPPFDLEELRRIFSGMRGEPSMPVDASIVVPVNAAKDLDNIFYLLCDLGTYKGQKCIEVILVVNNFAAENPPDEIETYQRLGLEVIAIPRVDHVGGVALAARIPGIRSANSQVMLLFDADCHIPNANALLDWYITQFDNGCDLAYTHVDYTDLEPDISIKVRMFIHHASRWFRRKVLGMPTSRGSNYAIRKELILDLFVSGRITYDIHVGPAVKAIGGMIAYSDDKDLRVLTSGRFFQRGWKVLFSYLIWRTGYYKRQVRIKSQNAVTDR